MLRELPNVRQIEGEPNRLWFFCHEQDLVVFEDEQGDICGFQLAYDKQGRERSVAWKAGHGFAHYCVDSGEATVIASETPILSAGGPFSRDRVLEQFLRLADELPHRIVAFVANKLQEFDGPTQA